MDTPTRILLTGFEPFGLHADNPSEMVVRQISTMKYEAVVIDSLILPVSFHRATDMIRTRLEEVHYDYVLSLGFAAKRECISLERIAINCMDASIPDNDGCRMSDAPIFSGGPVAYFATLPIKVIKARLGSVDLSPCRVSNTAGTFVCNAVFYAALHVVAQNGNSTKCGFVHLPSLQRMSLEEMVRCIDNIIKNLK